MTITENKMFLMSLKNKKSCNFYFVALPPIGLLVVVVAFVILLLVPVV
jgi:hypothetical protein